MRKDKFLGQIAPVPNELYGYSVKTEGDEFKEILLISPKALSLREIKQMTTIEIDRVVIRKFPFFKKEISIHYVLPRLELTVEGYKNEVKRKLEMLIKKGLGKKEIAKEMNTSPETLSCLMFMFGIYPPRG